MCADAGDAGRPARGLTDPFPGSIARVRDRYLRHAIPHVARILRRLLEHPAEQTEHALARYLAENPRLGSSDRAIVGDLVFAHARWRRRIDAALAEMPVLTEPTGEAWTAISCGIVLAAAGYDAPVAADAVRVNLPADFPFDPSTIDRGAAAFLALDPSRAETVGDLSVRANLPDWIVPMLADEYGWERARRIAVASRDRAPVVLRANVLRATREEALAALAAAGIAARPTALSPWGIVLEVSANVRGLSLYRDGAVEVQDEGSQIVGLLAGAEPGMRVVDACAGAGGKTLCLAATMENRGEIIARDPDREKLAELRRRADRAGATIVRAESVHDRARRRSADAVLVDAPCTGSGTWRRTPDGPDHFAPADIGRHAERQREILDRSAAMARPGGRLVYATCSIFREENADVVAAFLDEHPEFALRSARDFLPADIADRATSGSYLALTPEMHGTDGFFAAVMERTA